MGSSFGEPDELPNQLSAVDQRAAQELCQRTNNLWRSNYHEASIYIEEGLNNDKFENHPKKRARKALASSLKQAGVITTNSGLDGGTTSSKIDEDDKKHGFILGGQYTTIETYILVHNRYFYQLDLAASIILLILALVEPPAVDGYELNPKIHAAIEMFALGIIAIELLLKFRWMGPRRFFRHGRTVTKLIVLLAMNFEAIVIFLRHSIHARYSRALRPIFLIDNHYCHGLRRAVRQIFQSLPPIIDMFTLALFFMFVFSIFGFYLFASNNYYFSDMPATIGNLLILATTANLPDVMMPSYNVTRWSAIFFVLFVIIHLFLFTNLTMAAVYEIFTRKEKEKFHKLLLHRRKACQQAFKLLVSRRQPNRIQYRQFMGLMRYLNRKCSMFDAYLIFKALDTDKNGSISLEEFYQIYDFINLEWKLIYPHFKWYDNYERCPKPIKLILSPIERLVNHRIFEWTIDVLIAGQAVLQFIEATTQSVNGGTKILQNGANLDSSITPEFIATSAQSEVSPDKISTYAFISVFVIEAILRCLASGPSEYWQNRWNRFDLVVLLISFAGLLNGSLGGQPFGWVIVLRVLRLMRLFEFKRRYRDMWQTLTYILLKRFVSMTCVVMILYYFFAIIGMELLGDYDLRNCCKNTTLESQFKFDINSSTLDNGLIRYYLNDFGDLVASYLTLFSMSSNTYWLTLMSAYTIVSGTNWVRLFFSLYYLCSIIVMNIVIAFILESFLFHIHYRTRMGDNCDDTNLFTVSVTLSSFEVDFLRETLGSGSSSGPGSNNRASFSGRPNSNNNKLECMLQLDRTVAKVRRAQEERKFLNYSSSSYSSTSNSSAATKIIGDDYTELPNETEYEQQRQQNLVANERTCLIARETNKARKDGKRKASTAAATATATATATTSGRQASLLQDTNITSHNLSVTSASSKSNKPTITIEGNRQQSTQPQTQPATQPTSNKTTPPMTTPHQSPPVNCPRRPEFYLIYQAEQIRNKFSFTMKMYADEVEGWLAEAERTERDAMSQMISRNQLRAEHVAMARLARRNLAEMYYNHRAATTSDDLHHHPHHDEAGYEGSPSGPLATASHFLAADWGRPRALSTPAWALKAKREADNDSR